MLSMLWPEDKYTMELSFLEIFSLLNSVSYIPNPSNSFLQDSHHIYTHIYTYVQLTLEKCRFELHGSTFKHIFFNVNTAVPHNLWLAEPENVEYQLSGFDQNGF